MGRPVSTVASLPILRRLLVHLLPQIRKQRWLISGAMFALFAEILFRLLEPWPLKFVFDYVVPGESVSSTIQLPGFKDLEPIWLLTVCAIALIVFTCLRAACAYISTIGFALAGNRVLTATRSDLFSHLQRLSLSFHHKARTGDLLTRVIGDIGRLQEITITAMLPLIAHLLMFVGILGIMFWINWQLALIATSIIPLFVFITKRLGGKIHHASRRQRQREGRMAATAAEAINAMHTVQALSLEHVHDAAFDREGASSLKEGVRAKRFAARLERTVDVLIAIGTSLVLWRGAYLVLDQRLSPGDLIVFLAYLKNAYKPMRDVAKYTGRIAKAAACGDRLLEVMETTPEITNCPGAIKAPQRIQEIIFDHVSFTYDQKSNALSDVVLTAEISQVIALVGPSGAGKSTLMNLLLRLYDPSSGMIMFNGKNLREFTFESIRGRIALVPQDNDLFAVSVHENIAYGLEDVSRTDVIVAAKTARAHEFIMELPEHYDTIVSERGLSLSGGQRQRIAVARAALRCAPILILDEPTASLDHDNAVQIRAALRDLCHDRITFVIAHDLTTVEEADLIVCFDHGSITEQGTYQELIVNDGAFAKIAKMRGAAGVPVSMGVADAFDC